MTTLTVAQNINQLALWCLQFTYMKLYVYMLYFQTYHRIECKQSPNLSHTLMEIELHPYIGYPQLQQQSLDSSICSCIDCLNQAVAGISNFVQ